MAKMVNPEVEVVRFENEDVIATSYRGDDLYLNLANGAYYYADTPTGGGVGDVGGKVQNGRNGEYVSPKQYSDNSQGEAQWKYNSATGNYDWVDRQ